MQPKISNIIDELKLYIPVSMASKYSGMSITSYSKHIRNGFLPHRGGNYPENATPEEIKFLSEQIEIPLSELPSEAIKSYIMDHIVEKEHYFNPNFLGFQEKYGKKALNDLLNDIKIIKDISLYRQTHYSDAINNLEESIFKKYELSSTKFYNEKELLEEHPFSRGLFKKLVGIDKPVTFKKLCPLSKDFIMNRLFNFNHTDHEVIYKDLVRESLCHKEIIICTQCPHNPSCSTYYTALETVERDFPTQTLTICNCAGSGLIVPESNSTVHRFIKTIPKSMLYFAQNEYNQWIAHYGYKLTRELPERVNQVGCSDHTELDIVLIYGYTPDNKPIVLHPWATVQIDIASGLITGSVLTFRPDRETIGQCFAQAVGITVNNPEVHGVPKTLLVDRGRDYKSKYLCENDPNHPNVAIFENGLLPALGCKVMHCAPRSPWVKNIERTNLKINKMLCRYPGYTGGKRKRRFKYMAEKEYERLLKAGRIMTMEKFAWYWYNEIIPALNNQSVRGNPSPMEKYRSLPKEETLTPEWSALSVFLKRKESAKVKNCKIKFDGHIYRSSLLDNYADQKVLVYTLDPNYHDSVFLLKGSKYIGEAFLEDTTAYLETNKYKLQKELFYRHIQSRRLTEGLQIIRYMSEVSNLNHKHYIDEDVIYTVGEAFTDAGHGISDGALAAAKAEYDAKSREIEKYQIAKKESITELLTILKKIASKNQNKS